jgi:hypothetical protein
MCFNTCRATYLKIIMKMSCDVITAVLFTEEDTGCVKRGEKTLDLYVETWNMWKNRLHAI